MTTKQTAANNELLRATKRLMNEKIFKEASATLNAAGEDAAIAYLQNFFRNQISTVRMIEMSSGFKGAK
jgi:hypothetical protein